jgi:hypothetical protein
MGGGVKGAAAGARGGDGSSAIGDGWKLPGVAQVAATVHGLTNRGHREKAETTATSPEPFARPGKEYDAVAAITDGRCSPACTGIEANGYGSTN